jgi:hypothetical protein
MTKITIPLDSLKANLSQRPLDRGNIKRLMFFIPGNDRKRTFYIDNIRLD